MRCQVPQISWHSRDPVLSIDFQPIQNDLFRLASGGTDSHVLIWYVKYEENKSIKLECASDLYRHNKSVNVVRFSPNGEFLASGDDEGAMFIWELKERDSMIEPPNDDETVNKEEWYPVKLLRGHLDDIYDICWSKDGNFLTSASMDNTVILWDMQKYVKTHIFSDFKGYVQGVTWDPCSQFIASVGSDRALRIHNIKTKKLNFKVVKAPWTNSTEKGTFKARLFYDDTLQSYFRRLTFTPDGEFLIVPSGILEKGEKVTNTCYIFSRYALNKPVISLPTGDKYTVAVKCNPYLFKLRKVKSDSDKENKSPKSMLNLPYRMIFAVAASDSVLLYDTEQLLPFAYVSNIHYTHLTDLSWSSDGLTLVISSTDGYCSFLLFSKEELGEVYIPEKPKEEEKMPETIPEKSKVEKMDVTLSTPVAGQSAEKETRPSTCTTPKISASASVKSPKTTPVISKDDISTPPSKPKITSESKKSGKKSPKMCSIKKFFITPKSSSAEAKSSEKLAVKESVENKKSEESINQAEADIITLTDSPLKETIMSVLKPQVVLTRISDFQSVAKNQKEEAMDVDDHSAAEELPKVSLGAKRESKCKVQLDFTDEVKTVADHSDNASDGVSKSKSNQEESDIPKLLESESDWKLELSQDEEVVPMEVVASTSKNPSDVPKSFQEALKLSASDNKTSAPKTDSKEPTKRRVSFVTLSSKATLKK